MGSEAARDTDPTGQVIEHVRARAPRVVLRARSEDFVTCVRLTRRDDGTFDERVERTGRRRERA